jgi:CheY-like chemotaxis protein
VAEILVIDDESAMRFLLRVTLELAGHHVEEAPNGKVAIERIEGGRIPDLVATDYMMPLMDGAELIDQLRRNPATKTVPIILVSASAGSERRTTADAFFHKPFDPGALTQRVAELLEKRK